MAWRVHRVSWLELRAPDLATCYRIQSHGVHIVVPVSCRRHINFATADGQWVDRIGEGILPTLHPCLSAQGSWITPRMIRAIAELRPLCSVGGADEHLHRGGGAGSCTVLKGVLEAVRAFGEIALRHIAQAAISILCQSAFGRLGEGGDGQRLAIRILVVRRG